MKYHFSFSIFHPLIRVYPMLTEWFSQSICLCFLALMLQIDGVSRNQTHQFCRSTQNQNLFQNSFFLRIAQSREMHSTQALQAFQISQLFHPSMRGVNPDDRTFYRNNSQHMLMFSESHLSIFQWSPHSSLMGVRYKSQTVSRFILTDYQ